MDDALHRVASYFAARDGGDDLFPVLPPNTVEDIFKDFTGRRSGLLQALTTDSDSLYLRCSPARSNLSIWGYPNGTWRVFVPEPKLPPDTPEPLIGINFCRDGMRLQDWLTMIAAHSDTWLLSLAYYFLAAAKLGADERKRLFGLINDLPTLFEVVRSR